MLPECIWYALSGDGQKKLGRGMAGGPFGFFNLSAGAGSKFRRGGFDHTRVYFSLLSKLFIARFSEIRKFAQLLSRIFETSET